MSFAISFWLHSVVVGKGNWYDLAFEKVKLIYLCMCASLHVYVCTHVCIYVCVCMSVYMYVSVYACVDLCACAR